MGDSRALHVEDTRFEAVEHPLPERGVVDEARPRHPIAADNDPRRLGQACALRGTGIERHLFGDGLGRGQQARIDREPEALFWRVLARADDLYLECEQHPETGEVRRHPAGKLVALGRLTGANRVQILAPLPGHHHVANGQRRVDPAGDPGKDDRLNIEMIQGQLGGHGRIDH